MGICFRSLRPFAGRGTTRSPSILLAWLTFYGSALAALKRAHIGFPGLVKSLPPRHRAWPSCFRRSCWCSAFSRCWAGWDSILDVLATDHLISLSAVSVAWTQSVDADQCGAVPDRAAAQLSARAGADGIASERAAEHLSASTSLPRRREPAFGPTPPAAIGGLALSASCMHIRLFGSVLALVLLNVPIAVALGIVAIVALVIAQGMTRCPICAIVIYNGATNFPLIAIPLFILAGCDHECLGHLAAADRVRLGAARMGPRRPLDRAASARRCFSPRFPARRWPTWPRWARS